MNNLEIRVDATAAIGLLGRISENFPRARTWALNRTAEEVNAAVQGHARQRLLFRGFRGEKVLNWYAPIRLPGKLRATDSKPWATPVLPYGPGKILQPFETGRPHTYDSLGRMVPMPTYGAMGLRTTKATELPRGLFPTRLGLQPMRDPKGTTYYALGKGSKTKRLTPFKPGTQGRIKQGKLRTFELPRATNPNESVVLQRQPGGHVRTLWIMKASVRRPKALDTYNVARRVVTARWGENMLGAFRFIVRTHRGRASLLDLRV